MTHEKYVCGSSSDSNKKQKLYSVEKKLKILQQYRVRAACGETDSDIL